MVNELETCSDGKLVVIKNCEKVRIQESKKVGLKFLQFDFSRNHIKGFLFFFSSSKHFSTSYY